MEINPEIFFEKSTIPVSFQNTEKILFQMKNCICKIYTKNGGRGTGFFCKIPYPDQSNLLTVLITNNHILDENELKNSDIIKYDFKDDEQIRKIKIGNNKRKIYTSKEFDITFIEIKQNEDNINEFLEIDEEIMNKNEEYIETTYKNKSIYIPHYPKGKEIVVSYGLLDNIHNETINHFCNTLKGSSGSPILSLDTFKVIGIHCGSSKDLYENCNKGVIINYPIKEFVDPNKKMFSLSYKLNYDGRIFGDKFVENNKGKCIMIINGKKHELSTHINKDIIKDKLIDIKLKEIKPIIDMSYMFYECKNLFDISNWDTSNIINMRFMFFDCGNIPDISKWDTSNVINMSGMFYDCGNIPDISKWDTSNVTNMSNMFCVCKNLPDISKWNTSKVIDMNGMFSCCNNFPDISKWNTSNVTDMSVMFSGCKNLPDVSKWDTSNVINMSGMFYGCKNLSDISKWDTSKIDNFNLSILKSSPININFKINDVKIINIKGNEYMTFSNLVNIFYAKANISKDNKKFQFIHNGLLL